MRAICRNTITKRVQPSNLETALSGNALLQYAESLAILANSVPARAKFFDDSQWLSSNRVRESFQAIEKP